MMLDKFEQTKPEVVEAMLSLGKIRPNLKHIDLGSGDGQIVKTAIQLGANSYGIEIDPVLAQQSRDTYGITVLNEDCFNSDVSKADVITCWFSLLPGTIDLMEKIHTEMKKGAILIKEAYTPSSWEPISVTANYPTEIFQGKNVFRVAGEIICIYKK
jgi:16S rRNA A1518/A1519 N6-dimethyltransferase RsmA/KsgA/DIM1 with predicted DNA glycosylase/AP lyase activity